MRLSRTIGRMMIYVLLAAVIWAGGGLPQALADAGAAQQGGYRVYMNEQLVMSGLMPVDGLYFVPLQSVVSVHNLVMKEGEDGRTRLEYSDSLQQNLESGLSDYPFKQTPVNSNRRVTFKGNDEGYAYIYVAGLTEYVDLKSFSDLLGYSFTVSENPQRTIKIATNGYKSILNRKNKPRLIVLPSYTSGISITSGNVSDESLVRGLNGTVSAFSANAYGDLLTVFASRFGDKAEIIPITHYLSNAKNPQLTSNLEKMNATANSSGSNPIPKQAKLFNQTFQWKENPGELSDESKEWLNRVMDYENAQGVVFTSVQQAGYGGYTGFYYKLNGFCYLQNGKMIPLDNPGFKYESISYNNESQRINNGEMYELKPFYYLHDKLYYVLPVMIYNQYKIGFPVQTDRFSPDTIRITVNNRQVTEYTSSTLLLDSFKMTAEQYASGRQIGQALAAMDEMLPNIAEGMQYYLLSCDQDKVCEADVAARLQNLQIAKKLRDIPDQEALYVYEATLLLKNHLFADFLDMEKKYGLKMSDIPEYTEMKAEQEYRNNNADSAVRLYQTLIGQLNGFTDGPKVRQIKKRIAEIKMNSAQQLDRDKKYDKAAAAYAELIDLDSERAAEYTLKTAESYEKARQYNKALTWYKRYLELKPDNEIEKKAHDMAVKAGVDDLDDKRARNVIRQLGFNPEDIQYYMPDYNKDSFRDLIIVTQNQVSLYLYSNGQYVLSRQDKLGPGEHASDPVQDNIPDIVSESYLTSFSKVKLDEPIMVIRKSRKLFSSDVKETKEYMAAGSRKAAGAKLLHIVQTNNVKQLQGYSADIKDKMQPLLNEQLAANVVSEDSGTITVHIQNVVTKNSKIKFDRNVTFQVEYRNDQGYVITKWKSDTKNNDF